VLVALGAAACYEVSYVLQALEARNESAEHGLRLSLLLKLVRNPRWAGATLGVVAGAALQLWALTLAPVTVVQPTLAVGLLALPLLARFVLHEHLSVRELLGIMAIVGGVSVVALAGSDHVGREEAGIELAIELVLLVALLLAPFALRGRGAPPQLAVLGAASGDAAAAIGLKLAADELHKGRVGAALAWGALGAACGAFALTAEMTALQQLRATRIAPVVVAFQVLVPVATGLAFLGDSWADTPGGGALLAVAVFVVVAGAALLSASRTVEEALGVQPEDHLGGSGELRE
jgi:drug/metabolite transporter (DMT)-like permease